MRARIGLPIALIIAGLLVWLVLPSYYTFAKETLVGIILMAGGIVWTALEIHYNSRKPGDRTVNVNRDEYF